MLQLKSGREVQLPPALPSVNEVFQDQAATRSPEAAIRTGFADGIPNNIFPSRLDR
jgi:hypothetical protein